MEGLNGVNRYPKTTKSLAVWRKIWQILTVSCKIEITLRNKSVDDNEKVLIVSRKLANILTVCCKSNHPNKTLCIMVVFFLCGFIAWKI